MLDGLLALGKREGWWVERSQRWALPEHQPVVPDEDEKYVEAIETLFRQQAFNPPGVEELVAQTRAPRDKVEKAMRILREHQRLVPVGEGLEFHAEAIERARQILVEQLQNQGRLESVQFKYLLGTTRKYALPLLDYFDRVGLLRRSGNTRFLKTPPAAPVNPPPRA